MTWTKETFLRAAATQLDHPSVYMGGPSNRSLRQADKIFDAIGRYGLTVRPIAERWPDGSVHDHRCQGECVRCWGADACGMVGQSCIPCTGSCVEKTGAVLPWDDTDA